MTAIDTKFEFKGLDHVALVGRDMKATVDFYHGVLDMPVLHTVEYFDDDGALSGQHWFFGVGDPSNPEAHIAIFCWKDGVENVGGSVPSVTSKTAGGIPIGSVLHVNLRVDADKIESYCAKLAALGIPFRHSVRYFDAKNPPVMRKCDSLDEYVEPEDGALMSSVYVNDPSGIQIEFNAWLPGWERWPNDAAPMSNDDDE